jgi:DNA repair exonuclease SbcCD ATPase subunit
VGEGSERATVERVLAYLGTLRAPDGQPVDERALDTITALLERAEAAERAILMYQAEALRALQRAEVAEGRKRPKSAAVVEYTGKACRVCGKPAPPHSSKRMDTLRVCAQEGCRQEARRRDAVIKQRRAKARKQAQQA